MVTLLFCLIPELKLPIKHERKGRIAVVGSENVTARSE